jgi:tetratricopeptide (TPR) repeat protein
MSNSPVLTILRLGDAYVFQFQAGEPAQSNVILAGVTAAGIQDFQARFGRTAQLLNQQLLDVSTTGISPAGEPSDPLLSLGRLIYNQLFPLPIQRALRELPPGESLVVATNAPDVPWELAHDDGDFLALKYAMSRRLMAGQPARRNARRPRQGWASLLIGNPTGDLPDTNEEIEQIVQLIEATPGTAPPRIFMRQRASRQAILQELASGVYQLVHYAGHARFDADGGGLVLARGESLTASELRQHVGGQPFVFVNGCESARGGQKTEDALNDGRALDYLGGAVQGLAEALLEGGALGFLGAFWPIHDGGSRQFALDFYRAALQGESLGAAVRSARRHALESRARAPLWASYTLVAEPAATLGLPARRRRRPATVLAVRIGAVERLFAELHGEEAAAVIDETVRALREQIVRYGGVVTTTAHHLVIGVFGLRPGHGNDAERAVRAALGLVEPLTRAQRRLPVGIGISSGDLFVPEIVTGSGAPTEGVWQPIVGEAAVEAVALAETQGEIWVARPVRRLVQHLVELAPEPGASKEGALRVLGLTPESRSGGYGAARYTELVGRSRELALLHEAFQQCRRGRGQLVGIAGEAGIGKSRLAQALRAMVREEECSWLQVACLSAYDAGPYETVGEVLRQALGVSPVDPAGSSLGPYVSLWTQLQGILDALISEAPSTEAQRRELLALLGETLGLPTGDHAPETTLAHLDAEARRRRLAQVLGRCLARRAEQAPVVLALEDLHWADEASLDVIDRLVVGCERLPVLVLALFRSESDWQPPWANRRNYQRLYLDRLHDEEGRALLAALLKTEGREPGEAAPELVDLVLARSGGNPLFLRELVLALQEAGALHQEGGQWRLARPLRGDEAPGAVQRVLSTRIESLPEPVQRVLAVAAVAGDDFDPLVVQRALSGMVDSTVVEGALAELEAREFAYRRWGEENYHFAHALMREAAYERLLVEERRRYHRRVGEALEQAGEPLASQVERLAHHFYLAVAAPRPDYELDVASNADPAQVRKAAAYLIQAGDRARSAYAAREALRYYRRARQATALLPGQSRQLVALHEGLGEAYQIITELDAAIDEFEQALAILRSAAMTGSERRRAADLARRLGRLYEWKSDYATALAWLERGLAWVNGLPADMQSATSDDLAVAAALYVRMGSVHFNRGDLEAAAQACRTALALSARLERHPVQAEGNNLLGTILDVQGRTQEALDYYSRSLALWGDLNDAHQAARVEDNIGVAYLYSGQWQAAQEHLRRGYAFWEQIEDRYHLAFACLNLGLIALYQGNYAEAQARFEQALAIWDQAQNQRWVALCHTNLGLLYIEQGAWSAAEHHLTTSRAILRQLAIRDLLPEATFALAEAALGLGRVEDALALAQEAEALAADQGMRLEQALALRTLGKARLAAGDAERARTALAQSLAHLEELKNRYELGRTHAQLARLETLAGDPACVHVHVSTAQALFTDLGALADLQRLLEMEKG